MTVLLDKKSKAAAAFNKIGNSNGTALPENASNMDALAYEYFIADHLASIADKRKKAAKEACELAGMLSHDKIPGNTVETYSSDLLVITAKTATPASRLDKDSLTVDLMKAIGTDKAAAMLKKNTKLSAPATTISFVVR